MCTFPQSFLAVLFLRMSIIPQGIGEPQGGSSFSLSEGQTVQNVDYSSGETGGATCEGTANDCAAPARELILRKRDNYL